MVTGINVRALTALRQVLGLPGEAQILDRVTQMAETGDDVRDRLRVDVRGVRPNAPGRAGLARDLGCDGAIWQFIPLLIEAGVDILNPWQVNCKGMDDTKRFKREFGADLTIWGGSCDTQSVLPFGTPQQVRDETHRLIEDLAPGGGYVFAPIHVIQAGVPPENIIAWWETLMEYGLYDET
jgi:hypothetical protein